MVPVGDQQTLGGMRRIAQWVVLDAPFTAADPIRTLALVSVTAPENGAATWFGLALSAFSAAGTSASSRICAILTGSPYGGNADLPYGGSAFDLPCSALRRASPQTLYSCTLAIRHPHG